MSWLLWSSVRGEAGDDKNVCDRGGAEDAGLVTLDGHNYPSIALAAEDASDGDTIYVCRGTYPTDAVLSDDLTLRAVDGPALTRLDGYGLRGPVLVVDASAHVVVDGFAIVDGDPDSPNLDARRDSQLELLGSLVFGSGQDAILLQDSADLVATDTDIYGNRETGIVAEGKGSVTLSGSRVWGNFAGGISLGANRTLLGGEVFLNEAEEGGGIRAEGDVTLQFVAIHDNLAERGAGAYHTGDGRLSIVASDLVENRAARGGGIYAAGSELELDASTIEGNVAEDGGGLWLAAPYAYGDLSSTLRDNSAKYGGGIYIDQSTTLAAVRVEDNVAEVRGGGILVAPSGGLVRLTSLAVIGNAAGDGGGGGLGFVNSSSPRAFELRDSHVAENTTTGDGGGVLIGSGALQQGTVWGILLEDNHAYGSGGGLFSSASGPVDVDYCDVSSNLALTGPGAAIVSPTTLSSHDSAWSNSPYDVSTPAGTYVPTTSDFTCSASGCVP